jgi:hypothetical protein
MTCAAVQSKKDIVVFTAARLFIISPKTKKPPKGVANAGFNYSNNTMGYYIMSSYT